MSRPFVIRQIKGAIATIVVYLRGKKKLTPELRSKAIQMADKETKGKKKDSKDMGKSVEED